MAITFVATVEDRWQEGKKTHSRVKLVSGGADTYVTGGADLPAFGVLGMKRNLDYVIITGPSSADGYELKYDQAAKKIKVFQGDNANVAAAPSTEIAAATAFASKTIYIEAVGS